MLLCSPAASPPSETNVEELQKCRKNGTNSCANPKKKKKIHPSIVPVVVHVTDEHGVESVEVSAEHGELIQDEQLGLLVVTFAVSLQQLLLGHDLRLQHINNSSPANQFISVSVLTRPSPAQS